MNDILSILYKLKEYVLFGNTAFDYLTALLVLVGSLVGLKIFQVIILARLRQLAKKTKTKFDDVLIDIFQGLKPPFYVLVSLFIAFQQIVVPNALYILVKVLFIMVLVYEVVQAFEKLIDYGVRRYSEQAKETGEGGRAENESMLRALQVIARIALWVIGIIVVLSNVGVNVTSLVASLGIGGIAIALALQNVLGDIFSSFSIYFDKPFEIGDFVEVGEHKGKVEKIGLKTTRLRSLKGDQIIISNKELTSGRVSNYRRMKKRRHDFVLMIEYGTKLEKLKMIPKIIEEIISSQDNVEFDRCFFLEYGEYSLNFKVIYHVLTREFSVHAETLQSINYKIYERFEEEGINFAFPTQVQINQKTPS